MFDQSLAAVSRERFAELETLLNKAKTTLQGGAKPEGFSLASQPCLAGMTQVKATVKMQADQIVESEILIVRPNGSLAKSFLKDSPYRLQQVQDSINCLANVLESLHCVRINDQVLTMISCTASLQNLLLEIRRSRTMLECPKRKSLEEHVRGQRPNFMPPLPKDMVLSWFLSGQELALALYIVKLNPADRTIELVGRCSATIAIPRLQLVIDLLDEASQLVLFLLNKI
ncbi:hypothetical protein Ciccas_007548 [Cichlidogyrus casuarinus]|uniref:Uncharacterized protein n=1 Tax=Cichlidogyrus casuarinus TaxID=1844966 RepID=A0ABD2Q2M0_9PLAT